MNKTSVICILLAGSLWGSMGFFVRSLTEVYGFSSLEVVSLRLITAAVTFVVFLAVRRKGELKVSTKDLPLLAVTGLSGVLGTSVTYFLSMKYSTLAVAAILMYTAPIMVMIASFFLFGERITGRKILSIILAFSGCVLVSGIIGSDANVTVMGVIMGVMSGVTYGSYSVFGTYCLRKHSSFTLTAWAFVFAAAGSLLLVDVPEMLSKVFLSKHTLPIVGLVLGMGILTSFLAYIFYTIGLSRTEASKAIIVASVEPLVATVVGIAAFGETPTVYCLVGILLILGSVMLTAKR